MEFNSFGTSALINSTGMNKTHTSSYSNTTNINVSPKILVGGNINLIDQGP